MGRHHPPIDSHTHRKLAAVTRITRAASGVSMDVQSGADTGYQETPTSHEIPGPRGGLRSNSSDATCDAEPVQATSCTYEAGETGAANREATDDFRLSHSWKTESTDVRTGHRHCQSVVHQVGELREQFAARRRYLRRGERYTNVDAG